MDRERLEDPLSAETGAAGPVGGHRPFTSRFGTLQTELARQLRAEPGVSGVTMAASVPRRRAVGHHRGRRHPAAEKNGIFGLSNLVQFNQVDDAFFDVYDIPVLIGRGFKASDLESERNVVIVNQTFAARHISFAETSSGRKNPLGHRNPLPQETR